MWYEKLKLARKVKGLSLREVAEIVGFSNAFLSQIESGQIKDPSFFKLVKLLKLYNLTIDDMIEKP